MTVTLTTTPSLCRICFWRRNEIALRIASSISTSNYDPTTSAEANFAAAGATLAPRHDVVACFEPEWNSLGVNKTRSFNILGGIRDTGTNSFAAFAPAKQSPRPQPCARGREVFVISGGGFGRQPLEKSTDRPRIHCGRQISSRRRMARKCPVAQPRPHRATGQIQGKHDEAKVEPIAGAGGDHACKRHRDQRRRQHRQPPRRQLRYALTTMNHRDPAHRETQQQRRQQPVPMKCHQICHRYSLTTKSMRRFCALPSSVSLVATGWVLPYPIAVNLPAGKPAFTRYTAHPGARSS